MKFDIKLKEQLDMSQFKTGDIFISLTGGGCNKGVDYSSFNIFEYREGEDQGKGFKYSTGGKSYCYYWAYPKNENKIINIPDDILFSFKHGSDSFEVNDDLIVDNITPEELIRISNFSFVTNKEVNSAKIIESIKDISDVKENWQHIKEHGVSFNIAEICFNEIGVKLPPVKNGEIGIHAMYVIGAFYRVIDQIESKLGLNLNMENILDE